MKYIAQIIFGAVLAQFALAAPLSAQDPIEGHGSMQVGNATVSVEAGALYLDLPSTDFTGLINVDNIAPSSGPNQRRTDHDGDGWGWRADASIESPINAFDVPIIGAIKGFYGRVTSDQGSTCVSSGPLNNQTRCAWFGISNSATQPPLSVNFPANGDGFVSMADRDVDVWGLALESQVGRKPQGSAFRFKFGADWRNIDQNTQIILTRLGLAGGLFAGDFEMEYRERLDTYYLGGYVGLKGQSILSPTLALLTDAQIGLYHAHADYDGWQTDRFNFINTAADSEDEVAGIAVAKIGLRKDFRRSSVTLNGSMEWYSWVPEMKYNDVLRVAGVGTFVEGPNDGTTVGDGDAFSAGASLRFTFKLGPDRLFDEPLK